MQQSLPVDDNDLETEENEEEQAEIDRLEEEEKNADSDGTEPYRPETLEDLGNMTFWQHIEFWWAIISGFYVNFTSASIGQISPNLNLCYGNATELYDSSFGVYEEYMKLEF